MKRLSNSKKAIAVKLTIKQPKPIVSVKTTKPIEKKTIVSTPKIKPPTQKIKLVDSTDKSRLKNQKLKPPVSAKKPKSAESKKPTTISANSATPPTKKVKPVIAVKAKTKTAQPPIGSAKKIKAESVKSKAVENKVQKTKSSETKSKQSQAIKPISSRAKIAPSENKRTPKNAKQTGKSQTTPVVKAVENKIESKKLPLPPKPKKKRAKPICSAVFRGKKDRYGFEVFPLDAEFEDVSAIYVISKRKIDKRKKGHHALVCIGQTESLTGEIKRHKQGKCVKKYQANVISILPEENEKKRLRIETDLKAAHTVVCNLE